MGNIPRSERIPLPDVVSTIERARELGKAVIPTLMAEYGLVRHQAVYQYEKAIRKGEVPRAHNAHHARDAIMFLNTKNQKRIKLCQVCLTAWPCSHELFRLGRTGHIATNQSQTVAE